MKVYHLDIMYNGNIQQNSLRVESCVTEEFNISPRFSLHLRLPAAVAELAVYAVDEHHAGAVFLFSVRTSLTEYKMKEVAIIALRREDTKMVF